MGAYGCVFVDSLAARRGNRGREEVLKRYSVKVKESRIDEREPVIKVSIRTRTFLRS